MLRTAFIVAVLGLGLGPSEQLSKGVNEFSLDLYGEMAQEEENFVASPLNLSTSLAMVYIGAEGKTRRQMVKALHYPTGLLAHVASGFSALVQGFDRAAKGAPFELQLASSVWVDKSLVLQEDYKETLQKQFSGGLHQVNFDDSSAIVAEVNHWASDETNGEIPTLLSKRDIDSATRLMTLSTLYFKAPWKTKFDPSHTKKGPFHLDRQRVVQAPMMRQILSAPYLATDEFDMVGIHYAADPNGARFALLLILPKNIEGLHALEGKFSSEWLSDHLVKMVTTAVSVELPKFTIRTRLDAKKALSSLGMPVAFSKEADFSGISASDHLALNRVVHEALIHVEEEGTEASAATAAVVGLTSSPPQSADVSFRATHPFAFAIIDFNSGQILFVGRVMHPKAL